MPTTLNPTCPLCGLRYTDRPLLELHFREDHRPRDRHAEPEPDPGDPADTATSRRVIAAGPGRHCTGWSGRCGTPTTS